MGLYKSSWNLIKCCYRIPGRSLRVLGSFFGSRTRLVCEIAFEIVLVVFFLKVYNHVRNQFGSQKCSPQHALMHAQQVIKVEQLLGMYWEQEIQKMVLQYPLFIGFWNIYYGTAHMVVTVFVLTYLFTFKPAAYQRCRTIFMVMNIIALAGYASYPLMPPRLINDCTDPYGGCLKEPQFQFVDTLHEFGGLWSWKSKGITKVSNHYAAMPSMHVGYSTWCSTSIFKHSQSSVLRVLALFYPLLTLYCITVTANHYPLDAVFGLLVLFIAAKVAVYLPEVGRGAVSSGISFAHSKGSEDGINLKATCLSPKRHFSEWSTIHRSGTVGAAFLNGDVSTIHRNGTVGAALLNGDVESGEHREELVEGLRDPKGRLIGCIKKL
ncbi:PAP2 superfamily-domain-containing protein [Dunaliella salina]|uniref:PAP2 superfamily-domain-containing protein n=1 Tax=Dunaliella salina TaxID=3046 RepID=A0ABQ7G6F4_DUNSA|nr:PAP2 superfamily-domain-containing protein [Dunaliella salina]|eukprot:KAF5830192.1 PAP2 superfamily-domain-containing protein [Dunaliella salina]